MKLVGFDIFETLLMRRTSPPTAIFFELGKIVKQENSLCPEPAVFAEQRRLAEMRCYETKGSATTLRDIYAEMLCCINIPDRDPNYFVEKEYALEKSFLEPIDVNVDILKSHRENGDQIVYVSDMYHSSDSLKELLIHNGIFEDGDSVMVSCEYGLDKRKGKLFKEVMKRYDVSPEDFCFYGNHPVADVEGARLVGVSSTHLPIGNPNRFELLLGDANSETLGLSGKFAGASRSARVSCNLKGDDRSLAEVGAGVAAPLLVSYVLWLFGESERLGLRKLYFLARDGEVMLEIARVLAKKLGLDIELQYLYASRCAWARGSRESSLGDWYMGDVNSGTTARDILTRLDIELELVKPILASSGYQLDSIDEALDNDGIHFFRKFIESDDFKPTREKAIQENRELIKDYLKQEGLFEVDGIGIVDVGWSGSLYDVAADIVCEEIPDSNLHGFLFGAKARESRFSASKHGFYFDENSGRGGSKPLSGKEFFIMMEVFCCASHGTLLGYSRQGEQVVPITDSGWAESVNQWGLGGYRSAVLAFAAALEIQKSDLSAVRLLRPSLGGLIEAFWNAPTSSEARRWGSFPWNCGQGGDSRMEPLANRRSLSGEFFKKILSKCGVKRNSNPWEWRAGSVSISSFPYRLAFHAPKLIRKTKGHLRELKKDLRH